MRELLVRAFQTAVAAVNPRECVRKSLTLDGNMLSWMGKKGGIGLTPSTPIYLIAFGKAAAAMTEGAEMILGSRLTEGIAIVPKEEEGRNGMKSAVYEASRDNLPDERSIEATKNVVRMIEKAERDAVFLVLISGGGSALLSLPSKGLTLKHKLAAIKTLVSRGASIEQLNAVRRALSRVKGGRLLEEIGERQNLSLILSDIVGDPLEFIASGPTVPPQSSIRAATVVNELSARGNLPKEVIDAIDREKTSSTTEFLNSHCAIIANNSKALEGIKEVLEAEGYKCEIATSTQVGNAEEFGKKLANTVIERKSGGKTAIMYGGETTVNLPSPHGIGGRNQHAALSAMIELWRRKEEWKDASFSLLLAGSDGQDGPTDAAGVIMNSQEIIELSMEEMEKGEKALREADSYNFWKEFRGGSCHFLPGLTGTNVMDITIVIMN